MVSQTFGKFVIRANQQTKGRHQQMAKLSVVEQRIVLFVINQTIRGHKQLSLVGTINQIAQSLNNASGLFAGRTLWRDVAKPNRIELSN